VLYLVSWLELVLTQGIFKMYKKSNIYIELFLVITVGVLICVDVSAQAPLPVASKAVDTKSAKAAVEPVDIKLERKKVTVLEGKEVLGSASIAKPGDVIEEVATYTNLSKKNTRRVEATLPVPQYTEPVLSSILPANAKASTNGTTFATIPLKKKVRQANGVMIEQPVPLAEYRFLRWSAIELAPEKKFVASARFRLLENVAPVTTPPVTTPRK
jgi:hypothetical protein